MLAGKHALPLRSPPPPARAQWGGPLGPAAVFASRAAAGGLAAQALVAYTLKDAADRGGLGTTSSRWLNLGLLGGLLAAALACGAAAAGGAPLPTRRGAPLAVQLLAAAFVGACYASSGAAAPAARVAGGGGGARRADVQQA